MALAPRARCLPVRVVDGVRSRPLTSCLGRVEPDTAHGLCPWPSEVAPQQATAEWSDERQTVGRRCTPEPRGGFLLVMGDKVELWTGDELEQRVV